LTVVVVNDFAYVNGGASQVAVASAIALARHGLPVIFFSAVGPPDPRLAEAGVRVVLLQQPEIGDDPDRRRAATAGIWNKRAARIFAGVLNECRGGDTIIHFHSWTKALSSSVLRKAVDLGFPVILTLHDYFSACPNGGFFDFQRNEICTRTPLSVGCVLCNCDSRSYAHKVWRVARQVAQHRLGHLPSAIKFFTVPSPLTEKVLAPYLPKDRTVFALPNPIEATHSQPTAVGSNSQVLFVGRLAAEKGALVLAAALKSLNTPATFVGDGPLRTRIQALLSNVQITGWLGRDAVNDALRKARFLVFPSLLYETQGLSVLEAAAIGVPALVPDSCAVADFVEDDKTGLHFRGGDEDDLRKKIETLLRDEALVSRLGRAAYECFWADPPTPEVFTQRLLKCYDAVLSTLADRT
jgi:glycosyltransferase involved in cell wall biosynthesis